MAAGTMKTAVAELEAEAAAKIKVTVAECFIVFRCIFCRFLFGRGNSFQQNLFIPWTRKSEVSHEQSSFYAEQ